MSHLFEARLVNGDFGDPGLFVDFRDRRRSLLFDIGELAALAPRQLMRVSHVFVTHTHMDHFAGFDAWLRRVLGRKERVTFTGGPRFIEQVEHKLRAYMWNVVHRYDETVIDVREIHPDGRGRRCAFSSRRAFEREDGAAFALDGDVLHDEATFRVRARFVDHDIPCLSFALEEKAHVNVDRTRLEALGVTPGPWLRELKDAVLAGDAADKPIAVRWKDRDGAHEMTRTVAELRHVVLDVVPGRRVGYVTDLRYTPENVAALHALLEGVDILYIESVFLDEDAEHGALKNHLTARQAGRIARVVGARALHPFHFSPRYEGRAEAVRAEALAAWRS